MRFWTIQTMDVLDILRRDGVFQPDFSKSRYLSVNPPLAELYDFVLRCYNQVNGTRLPGLVFAFAWSDNESVYLFGSSQEFYRYMCGHRSALQAFWNQLDSENSVVMELEYPEPFNPLFIEINYFPVLMPPILLIPPYTAQSARQIAADLQRGEISRSEFPSGVIQAHLPCIRQENVCNLYRLFELE